MNGPSHMEVGQVYYGESEDWSEDCAAFPYEGGLIFHFGGFKAIRGDHLYIIRL